MKRALLLATLTLAAGTAHADGTAYVDLAKVTAAVQATPESRQATRDLSAEMARQQTEVDAAEAAATKAKPSDAKAAKEHATAVFQQSKRQLDSDQQAVNDRLMARPNRIIAKVAAERKLSTVAPLATVLYASPKLDITEEVLRRFKAGEGFTTEEEAARLRAENASKDAKIAALEDAAKAALIKPAPPSIPPPPPTQPLASKARK